MILIFFLWIMLGFAPNTWAQVAGAWDRDATETLTNKTIGAATNTVTINASDITDKHAGTDITADLEEDAHCAEHDSGDLDCSGETLIYAPDSLDFTEIVQSNTLAGNPALAVDECFFMATATGGCFICEGNTADTNEQAYCFPDNNGADTSQNITLNDETQTLTNKTINAADNVITADDLICTDCINDTEISTNAGTALSADLEEEAHCSEHDGRSTTCNGEAIDADAELYTDRKCANIDPASATTNWIIYKLPFNVTITEIGCIVDAATSVVVTFQECDGNGGTCGNTGAAITCATTWTTTTVTDSAADNDDILRATRGTVTGSPAQAFACVKFTAND